jgi:endonuclease/exonuclease/phosphatase family metal-dependent hydrolase
VIRVVTYNVSGGLDVGAAGEVLAAVQPRVVCLLEAPTPRRTRQLARNAGLEIAIRAGKRGAGTAVLVHPDVRVRSTSHVPLTTPADVTARSATNAIIGVGGLRLSVTAVQFGLRPDVRATNLEELLAFLASIDAADVVGCDLNESVRSPVAGDLAQRYQDAHAIAGSGAGATYPTIDPSSRQDFLFVDETLTVLGCFVATDPPVDVASHHRPVVADIAGHEDDAERLRHDHDRAERRIA